MGLSAFNTKKGAQYKSKSVTKGEVHADRETWIVEADVVKQIRIPEGTTHAFRHGRVSILQQGNVPNGLIKRWVGHSSLKTTSKYSHFTREFRKQIDSKLG